MATKTKKQDEAPQDEVREGVLAHQGDDMDLTSENDLARSEDYDPLDDVVPFHAPDDPDAVEGVLAGQPTISDPQGIDDILTFEGPESKPKSRSSKKG